jgi:hypothetical protein
MYGVSMGKDGTSKVVCQTLAEPETEPVAHAVPEPAVAALGEDFVEVPAGERVHEPVRP